MGLQQSHQKLPVPTVHRGVNNAKYNIREYVFMLDLVVLLFMYHSIRLELEESAQSNGNVIPWEGYLI